MGLTLVVALVVGIVAYAYGNFRNVETSDKYIKLKAKYEYLVEAVTDGKGLPKEIVYKEKIVEKPVEKIVEKVKTVVKYEKPPTCTIGGCSGKSVRCRQGCCPKHCESYCMIPCSM